MSRLIKLNNVEINGFECKKPDPKIFDIFKYNELILINHKHNMMFGQIDGLYRFLFHHEIAKCIVITPYDDKKNTILSFDYGEIYKIIFGEENIKEVLINSIDQVKGNYLYRCREIIRCMKKRIVFKRKKTQADKKLYQAIKDFEPIKEASKIAIALNKENESVIKREIDKLEYDTIYPFKTLGQKLQEKIKKNKDNIKHDINSNQHDIYYIKKLMARCECLPKNTLQSFMREVNSLIKRKTLCERIDNEYLNLEIEKEMRAIDKDNVF